MAPILSPSAQAPGLPLLLAPAGRPAFLTGWPAVAMFGRSRRRELAGARGDHHVHDAVDAEERLSRGGVLLDG